ncbi:MAG: hypothetical protein COA42_09545 [Alteromonadaceae bacterium]|nr:MAG: hypothetical protein COA42_09545 [Alteromonadaceae bacterium]
MSLILDALNKADKERQKNNGAPSLHDVHEQLPPQKITQQNGRLVYVLIAIVALLCSVLGFIFWQQLNTGTTKQNGSAPQASTNNLAANNANNTNIINNATTSQSTAATLDFTQSTATRTNTRSTTNPQTTADIEDAAKDKLKQSAKYKEMQEKLIASQYERAKEEAKEEAREEAKVKQPKIAAQTPIQVTPTPAPTSTAAPVIAQAVSTPIPLPKTNRLSDHPFLGTIRDLPNYIQQEIPTLIYSAHNYYGAGAGSTVVLNKKTLSYGGQAMPKLYIEDILEDGIILRYKTHKFKLKALNSWVNL